MAFTFAMHLSSLYHNRPVRFNAEAFSTKKLIKTVKINLTGFRQEIKDYCGSFSLGEAPCTDASSIVVILLLPIQPLLQLQTTFS